MRQNDLLKSDTGDHLRVLLYGDQQSYVVNCQRCKMPFPISTPSLLQIHVGRYVAGNIHNKGSALPTPQRWNQQGTCLASAGRAHHDNVPLIPLW